MTAISDDAFVRRFQQLAGLAVDGIPGDATQSRLDQLFARAPAAPRVAATRITERMLLEILEHEGIVLEAYKDSVGVWTWGVGVTNASGHQVLRYKDAPSTMRRALEVYEWLLRTKYLPEVFEAFTGHPLTENELGAALSFHWNTGAIGTASWVASVKAGKFDQAHTEFLNWSKPREILGRRKAERTLFFEGVWTSDGVVTMYRKVSKPSYTPDWASAVQVDIRADLRALVAAAGAEA